MGLEPTTYGLTVRSGSAAQSAAVGLTCEDAVRRGPSFRTASWSLAVQARYGSGATRWLPTCVPTSWRADFGNASMPSAPLPAPSYSTPCCCRTSTGSMRRLVPRGNPRPERLPSCYRLRGGSDAAGCACRYVARGRSGLGQRMMAPIESASVRTMVTAARTRMTFRQFGSRGGGRRVVVGSSIEHDMRREENAQLAGRL